MDNSLNRDKTEAGDRLPRVTIYDNDDHNNDNQDNDKINQSNPETNHASVTPDTTLESEPLIDDYQKTFGEDSPDGLEHSIERTQERIANNIDELAKRLNPTHLKDQAVQSLNDSLNLKGLQYMVGDLRGTLSSSVTASGVKVFEGVKHNPLSAALLGVGAGVVALGGVLAARTDNTQSYSRPNKRYSKPSKRLYDERLRGMMETIENKVENKYGENSQTSTSGISGKVEGAKQLVSEGAHRAKDGLGQVLEAQPLAIGAVALLAGAAIGLLLPRSRYEDSLMGECSDQLMSQAKDKASEVVGVAKSTVGDVMQTAKDTMGEVVQTAKDTVKETARAVTA